MKNYRYNKKLLECMEYLEDRVQRGEYTDEEYTLYLNTKWNMEI